MKPLVATVAVLVALATGAPLQAQTPELDELRALAEQGHASAQSNLGLMYATGQGVPQDDTEAVRWFRLAADQGLAGAQSNLGAMYDIGEGVPEDDAEAVRFGHSLAPAKISRPAQGPTAALRGSTSPRRGCRVGLVAIRQFSGAVTPRWSVSDAGAGRVRDQAIDGGPALRAGPDARFLHRTMPRSTPTRAPAFRASLITARCSFFATDFVALSQRPAGSAQAACRQPRCPSASRSQ